MDDTGATTTAEGGGRRVVLVEDMLRGFLEPGRPLDVGDAGRAIIPAVRRRLEAERARGAVILWAADNHAPDDAEFRMWPAHCIVGTEETEVVPELADLVEPGNYLAKTRYSSFFRTDLDARLADLRPDTLVVLGVCTDICVYNTVADARERDYHVVVPADCVATFDPAAHAFALDHMRRILGAEIED